MFLFFCSRNFFVLLMADYFEENKSQIHVDNPKSLNNYKIIRNIYRPPNEGKKQVNSSYFIHLFVISLGDS